MAIRPLTPSDAGATSPPRVVISNGLNRFHLAVAAAEVAGAGRLELLLTGGYPTERVVRIAASLGIARLPRVARLLDRRHSVPEDRIASFWRAEVTCQLAAALRTRGALGAAERLVDAAFRSFARNANRRLQRSEVDAQIYHYRSGFGLSSVPTMKARGAIALCDHSIAHPLSLAKLLNEPRLSRRWQTVLRDLEQADHVVVNSDFVKQTFLDNGWEASRVHVIYLGVDDSFLSYVRPRPANPTPRGELRMLFAGSLEERKGVSDLAGALAGLDDVSWRLDVAGPVPHETRRRHQTLLSDERISLLGVLPRRRLADAMASADLFVFPTLAEGSARVVFEALAAGLFVVTTPNAGSIVVDGVHGALVPPRSPVALADAIRDAARNRSALHEIGRANAEVMRSRYTQARYRQALLELYDRLATGSTTDRADERLPVAAASHAGGRA